MESYMDQEGIPLIVAFLKSYLVIKLELLKR